MPASLNIATGVSRAKTNTMVPDVSRLAAGNSLVQALAPEHDRVLHWLRIVGTPRAPHGKAETFVQNTRRIVRSPNLERRPDGPNPGAFAEHMAQEGRGHARPTMLRQDGQIEASVVQKAIKDLGINPDKPNPAIS